MALITSVYIFKKSRAGKNFEIFCPSVLTIVAHKTSKFFWHSFSGCLSEKVNSNLRRREDLIKNQVLLLVSFRHGLPKNKKIELFLRKKIFIQKVFVVLKLSAFCFKISIFSFPGCYINFILHLSQLVCGIQSMVQLFITRVWIEFLEDGG